VGFVNEDRILERLDKLTLVVERLADGMERLEQRMDRMEQRMDQMDFKFQQLEDRLSARIEGGLSEVRAEIAALSARTDIIKEAVDSLGERMGGIEQLLAYHQDKWLEHDKAIWEIKRKL
jgi:chromosome segregation ATPase